MAWTSGPRGLFAFLPPAEKLPEKARPLAARFTALVDESRLEAKKAEEMRRQREQVRRDYEEALAEALLDSKAKAPVNPLPDYDVGIQTAEHRSGAALRAASRLYAELGDLLLSGREANLEAAEAALSADLDRALSEVEAIRTVLDATAEKVALLVWLRSIGPQATPYVPGTGASQAFENGLGQVVSSLRVLRHDLDEVAQRREAVPA